MHVSARGQGHQVATQNGVSYLPFCNAPATLKQASLLGYQHHGHRGSLASATTQSGGELGWARYYPFGALRLSGGTLLSDRLCGGQTRELGDGRRYFKLPIVRPSPCGADLTQRALMHARRGGAARRSTVLKGRRGIDQLSGDFINHSPIHGAPSPRYVY